MTEHETTLERSGREALERAQSDAAKVVKIPLQTWWALGLFAVISLVVGVFVVSAAFVFVVAWAFLAIVGACVRAVIR